MRIAKEEVNGLFSSVPFIAVFCLHVCKQCPFKTLSSSNIFLSKRYSLFLLLVKVVIHNKNSMEFIGQAKNIQPITDQDA